MRQLQGLLKVIGKSNHIDFYNSLLSYGTVHGAKLPSLNEFLNASLSKEQKETEVVFDEKTDVAFEAIALKRLEEMRAKNA